MYLYTHALLAQHLLPLVQPTDRAAYLWGSVIPDIRYLTGMQRKTTHLPDEDIVGWLERYPECEAFIQGYRVHCLVDQIDAAQLLDKTFPLNFLRRVRRKPLSLQQAVVLVELYYHKAVPEGLILTGRHNPILTELGIGAEHTQTYAAAMAPYLAAPSFKTAITAFTSLGVLEDTRVERYMNAYRGIQNNRMVLWIMMTSAKNARLEERMVSMYRQLTHPDTRKPVIR